MWAGVGEGHLYAHGDGERKKKQKPGNKLGVRRMQKKKKAQTFSWESV